MAGAYNRSGQITRDYGVQLVPSMNWTPNFEMMMQMASQVNQEVDLMQSAIDQNINYLDTEGDKAAAQAYYAKLNEMSEDLTDKFGQSISEGRYAMRNHLRQIRHDYTSGTPAILQNRYKRFMDLQTEVKDRYEAGTSNYRVALDQLANSMGTVKMDDDGNITDYDMPVDPALQKFVDIEEGAMEWLERMKPEETADWNLHFEYNPSTGQYQAYNVSKEGKQYDVTGSLEGYFNKEEVKNQLRINNMATILDLKANGSYDTVVESYNLDTQQTMADYQENFDLVESLASSGETERLQNVLAKAGVLSPGTYKKGQMDETTIAAVEEYRKQSETIQNNLQGRMIESEADLLQHLIDDDKANIVGAGKAIFRDSYKEKLIGADAYGVAQYKLRGMRRLQAEMQRYAPYDPLVQQGSGATVQGFSVEAFTERGASAEEAVRSMGVALGQYVADSYKVNMDRYGLNDKTTNEDIINDMSFAQKAQQMNPDNEVEAFNEFLRQKGVIDKDKSVDFNDPMYAKEKNYFNALAYDTELTNLAKAHNDAKSHLEQHNSLMEQASQQINPRLNEKQKAAAGRTTSTVFQNTIRNIKQAGGGQYTTASVTLREAPASFKNAGFTSERMNNLLNDPNDLMDFLGNNRQRLQAAALETLDNASSSQNDLIYAQGILDSIHAMDKSVISQGSDFGVVEQLTAKYMGTQKAAFSKESSMGKYLNETVPTLLATNQITPRDLYDPGQPGQYRIMGGVDSGKEMDRGDIEGNKRYDVDWSSPTVELITTANRPLLQLTWDGNRKNTKEAQGVQVQAVIDPADMPTMMTDFNQHLLNDAAIASNNGDITSQERLVKYYTGQNNEREYYRSLLQNSSYLSSSASEAQTGLFKGEDNIARTREYKVLQQVNHPSYGPLDLVMVKAEGAKPYRYMLIGDGEEPGTKAIVGGTQQGYGTDQMLGMLMSIQLANDIQRMPQQNVRYRAGTTNTLTPQEQAYYNQMQTVMMQ